MLNLSRLPFKRAIPVLNSRTFIGTTVINYNSLARTDSGQSVSRPCLTIIDSGVVEGGVWGN